MAFSFYKVTSKTKFSIYWIMVLGVRFLGASGHIISTNWSTSSLLLCVFLFKDTFFNMYCWFVNIEFMANSAKTHIWRKCICIFFVRYIIAFLHLGTLDSTSALLHFKQWSHQQQTKMWKNVALNMPRKRHLFTIWELKREAERWLKFSPPLWAKAHSTKYFEYWFWSYKDVLVTRWITDPEIHQ